MTVPATRKLMNAEVGVSFCTPLSLTPATLTPTSSVRKAKKSVAPS